jgi:hypothetical protein
MSKIQYIGIKKDNLPFQVVSSANFKRELNLLPDGRYRITVEKWRKNKSNPQLGYYFACVLPLFLQGAIDAGWEITSIEECDIWLKSMFANKNLINKHTGQIVSVPALKREMTTVEMSTFTNQVRDYAAEYLNIHIPDPETNLKMNL